MRSRSARRTGGEPVLCRLHSACFTGDLLGSLKCDCGPQLHAALEQIGAEGAGVLLYLNQEGRGIGLANKMRAYALQDQGFDTVEANHRLGFEDDERDFRIGANILKALGFRRVRLMTNNPAKVAMMQSCGLEVVERVPLKVGRTRFNAGYLRTKAAKSGHLLVSLDLVVGRWGARFGGRRFPCAVGRGGIGAKRAEGDGVTPVGRHRIEAVLWRRGPRLDSAGRGWKRLAVARRSGRATAGRTIRRIRTTTARCGGRTGSATRRCGGPTAVRPGRGARLEPASAAAGPRQRDLPARLARGRGSRPPAASPSAAATSPGSSRAGRRGAGWWSRAGKSRPLYGKLKLNRLLCNTSTIGGATHENSIVGCIHCHQPGHVRRPDPRDPGGPV